MDLEKLGAFLGIAAFLGLAILVLLVIQQARDLRRLRKWAGLAPERAVAAVETRGEEIPEPEHSRLARPFIKLGAGIHDRTARIWATVKRGYRSADRRSPIDLKIVVGVLVVALIAGIVVLTSGFGLYGEDEGKEGKGKSAPAPEEIEVAVLNGTAANGVAAVPGLANEVARDVKDAGYKVGEVANTDASFVETNVMFRPGMKAAARLLAGDLDGTLGSTSTQPMIAEIEDLAGKADLAVVLGADLAQEQSGSEAAAPPAETTADPAATVP